MSNNGAVVGVEHIWMDGVLQVGCQVRRNKKDVQKRRSAVGLETGGRL